MPSVLILTQFFPPETGAPQNRLSSLARHLKAQGIQVTVLTAMPNYPLMKIHDRYKNKWFCMELMDGINIYRSWIFVKKTNRIVFRLLNYFSFVFSSAFTGLFRVKKHDIIICESPPLFLGISAFIISFFKRSKVVFNVSDLWPESAEKLEIVRNSYFLKLAYRLEAWFYSHSALVSGQTQGIIKSISIRFPTVKTHWLPNGFDANQFDTINNEIDWRTKNGYKESDFIVLYAGILGYAQALEVIPKAASLINNKDVKFIIAGDGPQKEYLLELTGKLQLNNVMFIGNKPTDEMPAIIKASDTAIVPLKNIQLFRGAIPSKIFETLAFGKPILLGVDGEAKELFINEGKAGLFYAPEDEHQLAASILQLKNDKVLCDDLGKNGKAYVNRKFNRQLIAKAFYEKLIKL